MINDKYPHIQYMTNTHKNDKYPLLANVYVFFLNHTNNIPINNILIIL